MRSGAGDVNHVILQTGSDIVYNGTIYIYICIYIYIILNKLHLNIIRLIKYNIIRHDSHDHL